MRQQHATDRRQRDPPREEALASFNGVVHDGFCCYPGFATDPWLDGIRELLPIRELLETARSRHEAARDAFRAAGGAELS